MLADLRLQHFRSYGDASFEFGPGVNIIVGPNASGKTNLLEAALVLARGSSYRARDAELVQFEQPWARLDTHLVSGAERSLKLELEPVPNKSYELDGKVYKRLSLANSLPTVVFEPNHLLLLSGGPDRRRDYLDELLEQTEAGYAVLNRQYRRTLAQRNALLKHPGKAAAAQLFPWDVRLSQLAGQLVRARLALTEQLNDKLPALYRDLAQSKVAVAVRYEAAWPGGAYESFMLKKLEATAGQDRERGFTSVGPHREDLLITFDGHPAQESASRGEGRTLVLGLKILELELLAATRDQTPLLLLDDVFSELDGARRRALTEHLSRYQTFITTTDADIVLHHFTDRCTVIALG